MTDGLLPCPCCGSRTLPGHANYDICPVCFWEDDGTTALDHPSPVNRMACLLEARNAYTAWGAMDPEFVHRTRPPRTDEVPPGTPFRGELPYDRWPAVEVAPGVRFGWIGPSVSYGVHEREGFVVLADGRRAGLRVLGDPHADRGRAWPVEDAYRDRDAVLEVRVPGHLTSTEDVVAALRAGLAAEVVAQLPAPEGPRAPARTSLGRTRVHGGGGHGQDDWEASPEDPDRVAGWAEAQLRAGAQPGDELEALGPREWVVRRRSPSALTIRGVAVHDAGQLPPGVPGPLPDGTRCVLRWSSGLFPAPPPPAPPPQQRRRWGRG
ncbi:CPCC family cysteine-rich protein [Geodermatophilus sp. SYSU D00691]